MKVHELIALLKKMPQDAPVTRPETGDCHADECYCWTDTEEVTDVSLTDWRNPIEVSIS